MMHKLKNLIIILALGFFLSNFAYAADIEVTLDSDNGSSVFQVQDSGDTTQATVDSDGNVVIKGGLRLDSGGTETTTAENLVVDGKIGIGVAGPTEKLEINGNVILTGGGKIGPDTTNAINVASTGEPTLEGTARHSRRVTLVPDYPNAVITAVGQSGSASGTNLGTMTSENEMETNTWRRFYNWTSSQTALQDYYILITWQVPSDFDGFADSNAFQLNYKTENATNTNCALDFELWKDGGTVALYANATDLANTSWTTETVDDASIGSTLANDTIVIMLQLKSKDDYYARVGNIVINYLSKW